MTAADLDIVYQSFEETIHNVRMTCAMQSPVPIKHYPARVVISMQLAQLLEIAMMKWGNGEPYGIAGEFTFAGIPVQVVAAPGVWCIGRVFPIEKAA